MSPFSFIYFRLSYTFIDKNQSHRIRKLTSLRKTIKFVLTLNKKWNNSSHDTFRRRPAVSRIKILPPTEYLFDS